MTWTVASTKEYSPAELAKFSSSQPADAAPAPVVDAQRPAVSRVGDTLAVLTGSFFSIAVALFGWDRQLHVLGIGGAAFGALQLVAAWLLSSGRTADALFSIMNDLFDMPRAMRQLAVVQFLSWFGLFAMWIYTTSAVTSHHYGTTDATSAAFNEGANWVGVLFAAYNGFAALAAMLIPFVARRIGRRRAHLAESVSRRGRARSHS